MQILITGSTSAHVSARKHGVMPTFPGLIADALRSAGHDVVWTEPSITMDEYYISGFDAVIVGMTPPTSTTAHRIYGALSVIDYAQKAGNLTLLLDAPEPKKVWAGLRAIHKRPTELTKDFHHKRKEYKKVVADNHQHRLLDALERLYQEMWPTTIYPKFPWMSFPSVSTYIPQTGADNLVGINLDWIFLQNQPIGTPNPNADHWVVDVPGTSWSASMRNAVAHPVLPLQETRWDDQKVVYDRLDNALGCFVSTYRYGDPWWSPALAMSLSRRVPVSTDWLLSSMLGSSWVMLPQTIEGLVAGTRLALADTQRDSYLSACLSPQQSVELLCDTLFKTHGGTTT